MSGTLAGLLDTAFRSRDRGIETANSERHSPAELLSITERTRRALTESGVAVNEPVHVRFANRAYDLGVLLGIWQAGAVAVPVHAAAAPSTVERMQRASRARFLIDGGGVAVVAQSPPPDRALLRGAALVIFTSGSTGEPKGVVIGHQRLADKLAVLDRLLQLQSDDVVLSPLQITFIFGLWVSLLALMKGARLILVPKFTVETMARGLAEATVLAGVPSTDGHVALIGRAKDIISHGGNKIAPLEIDHLLGEHPDIAAALCAGVPDERLGEVIHAVIVPRADARLDAVALRDWLLARTERFKVPEVFYFRETLPSGSSGKADRRAVAQLAAEHRAQPAALRNRKS